MNAPVTEYQSETSQNPERLLPRWLLTAFDRQTSGFCKAAVAKVRHLRRGAVLITQAKCTIQRVFHMGGRKVAYETLFAALII